MYTVFMDGVCQSNHSRELCRIGQERKVGRYKVEKPQQVTYLFKLMTTKEIEKIKTSLTMDNGFEYLWKDMWGNKSDHTPLELNKRESMGKYNILKYIGVDGGADAITQTIGGFTQAMTGDMSEIVGFLKSGEVRALAVLTEERVPGFEQVPTAKEQGFDVVAVNWRGLYVPKGVSDATFNDWAAKLQKVADSAEWKTAMAANGLAPFTKVGGDFQGYIDGVVADVRQLSKEIGVIK